MPLNNLQVADGASDFVGGMALDATARTMDADGRLHISKSHISKATVNPYYGREIPGSERLGLDPNKVYYLFRDPIELARAASTFARLPILSKHIPIATFETLQEQEVKRLIVGTIGSDVEFNDPYLDADLCFWDAAAIANIETETVRELSCAYRYTPDMTPGEYHGQRYDGVMREIHGNHLAQVESGRAGSDVIAADSKLEITEMKMTKLGKALFVALGAFSPKLAQDSALPALVGQATKKTFKKDEVKGKLLAMDSELRPETLDGVMASLIALDAEKEEEKPAEDDDMDDPDPAEDEDESEEDKKKRLAKEEKVAKDAEKKLEGAMDAFKKELRDADEARRAVRPVVGDVIAQDSAAEIYGFALDHLKVDHKGVEGVPALKALFSVATRNDAPAPRIAQDSAGAAKQFPGLSRFVQG